MCAVIQATRKGAKYRPISCQLSNLKCAVSRLRSDSLQPRASFTPSRPHSTIISVLEHANPGNCVCLQRSEVQHSRGILYLISLLDPTPLPAISDLGTRLVKPDSPLPVQTHTLVPTIGSLEETRSVVVSNFEPTNTAAPVLKSQRAVVHGAFREHSGLKTIQAGSPVCISGVRGIASFRVVDRHGEMDMD